MLNVTSSKQKKDNTFLEQSSSLSTGIGPNMLVSTVSFPLVFVATISDLVIGAAVYNKALRLSLYTSQLISYNVRIRM